MKAEAFLHKGPIGAVWERKEMAYVASPPLTPPQTYFWLVIRKTGKSLAILLQVPQINGFGDSGEVF